MNERQIILELIDILEQVFDEKAGTKWESFADLGASRIAELKQRLNEGD